MPLACQGSLTRQPHKRLLLAQSRRATPTDECPLWGEERDMVRTCQYVSF